MIIQTVGWIGTALIVSAYFLVSYNYVTSQSAIYQLMNLFGAICVGVDVFRKKSWPALTLQIIWGIIALVSLIQLK